ncbi:RidA family protein [Pantoea agglomerans]|uniref:RidA family protein n=1 Tax=Enterobacter agglomerans TaxID=549 RepID=A0AAN2FCN4_ENTAG|nr:RidA family protein [Pantoea agglomerans]CAH6289446.1 RidA family protein [Pantoea agglomerans]
MNEAIRRYNNNLPFPFATATEVNGILYLSGQVSMTAQAEPVYGDVVAQTDIVLGNISKTLEGMGSGFDNIFKVTVWLSDMKHFAEFNRAYAKWFKNGFPSRSVVSCSLAFNLDVEIEVQALAQKPHSNN